MARPRRRSPDVSLATSHCSVDTAMATARQPPSVPRRNETISADSISIGKMPIQVGSGISGGLNSPPANENLGRCSRKNPNSSQAATPDILVLQRMGHAKEICDRDVPASIWHPHHSSWWSGDRSPFRASSSTRPSSANIPIRVRPRTTHEGCVFTLPIAIGKIEAKAA